jgi:hypothetical protein
MAGSSVSTFMRSFLRLCRARPAAAALMALALGGAVAGGALALSPTVDTTLVFRGGVPQITASITAGSQLAAYTVPAGRRFMLTDLVIANSSATSPAYGQSVYTGLGGCASFGPFRTAILSVPAGGTLHLPFVTGFGFTAGQVVCISNADDTSATDWTIRGYLFE